MNLLLDQRAVSLLLVTLLLVIAPHLAVLPWWLTLLVVLLGAWRWLGSHLGWRLPGRAVLIAMTLLSAALIFADFGTLAGRDAGVALMTAMLALKLLELRQRRDLLVLLFLAYFVLATHFLYSQSIPLALYLFSVCWLLVALHIHLSRQQSGAFSQSLRSAALLLGQALPLMVALFLLFPRLPGPLWSLPEDANTGMTGLDDSMSPGNISHLSQSDAVAFRVSFAGEAPPPAQRYWRGPVLTLSDGRNWRPLPATPLDSSTLQGLGEALSYTVTLEPHNRKWLFVLDLPASITQHGSLNSDFQLIANESVRQRLRYSMVSYPSYTTRSLDPGLRHAALQLPPQRNARSVALGQSLQRRYHNDDEIVAAALSLFNTQPFAYTLSPPLLRSADPVDEFLFDTRRGFCEHYAAAFVTLMRAAAIPARVVTGYQGGEYNAVGNFYLVRQRDAHAWAEVWLDGRGWVRVDPTAAVAPERVERGIDLGASNARGEVLFQLAANGQVVTLMQQLRQNFDALDNAWDQWVLGYGPEQQAELLRRFGVDVRSWQQLGWAFAIVIGGLTLLIAASLLMRRGVPTDPVQREYLKFCRRMARQGIERRASESASDYAQRIIVQHPELAPRVMVITRLYSQLRYGAIATPQQIHQFRLEVNRFRP